MSDIEQLAAPAAPPPTAAQTAAMAAVANPAMQALATSEKVETEEEKRRKALAEEENRVNSGDLAQKAVISFVLEALGLGNLLGISSGNDDYQRIGNEGSHNGGWHQARLAAGAVCGGHVDAIKLDPGAHSASDVILALAKSEVGVHEVGNNGGQDVLRYDQATGAHAGDPWCASFVSYIYQRAGISDVGTASAIGVGGQFEKEGAFHHMSDHYEPKGGDVLVFEHHVAIVSGVTTDKDGHKIVHTIEGNSDDKVAERSYSLDKLRNGENHAVGFGDLDKLVEKDPKAKGRFQPRGEAPAVMASVTPSSAKPDEPHKTL